MTPRPAQRAALWAGLCACLIAGTASAALINLSHNNSSATIADTSADLFDWSVDGTDQLFTQPFYYRVGASGPQSDFSTLTLDSAVTFLGSRGAELTYDDPGGDFTITITYLLTGGTAGSGQSLMAEEVSILNTSGGSLDFHLFQYADFDMYGTAAADTVEILNANTVRQWEGALAIEETVVTPAPSHYSADFRVTVFSDVANADTLNDNSGPTGTGDTAWAFQWDSVLADGQDLLISKNLRIETVVPVPAAVWLFGSSLALLGWIRRRLSNR